MEHSFNVAIAKEYGIVEAILLQHIYFWIQKNKANNKHFYDNNYWTYNSTKAFSELFPYLTERQIKYYLKKLIDLGIIIKGNYNKNPYDRTNWYAISAFGYSILKNSLIDWTKSSNEKNEIVQPIPDINTDINTDSSTNIDNTNNIERYTNKDNNINNNKINKNSKKFNYKDKTYFKDKKLNDLFIDFLDMRKQLKAVNSERAINILLKELDNYNYEKKIKVIEQSIAGSWKSLYPLKKQQQKLDPDTFSTEGKIFFN